MPLPLLVAAIYKLVVSYAVTALVDTIFRQGDKSTERGFGSYEPGTPSNDEGNPVPTVWGHAYINSANLFYASNFQYQGQAEPFVIAGETYYKFNPNTKMNGILGFALCRGPLVAANSDGVLLIRFSGKTPVDEIAGGGDWCRTTAGVGVAYPDEVIGALSIKDTDLASVGIQFDGTVHAGLAAEAADVTFQAQSGIATLPAWRGVAYYWCFNRIGRGAVLDAYWFEVRRCPNNLGLAATNYLIQDPDAAALAGIFDANPAEMIYELLTDADTGLGLTADDVATASFTAAGNTLFDETFGMSLTWDGLSAVKNILDEILKTIGAVLYQDTDGKIAIKLLRSTDTSQLTVDVSNTASLEMGSASWTSGAGMVIVEYPQRSVAEKRLSSATVTAADTSRFQYSGGIIPTRVEYRGIRRADLATRLATRDLRILSTPIRKFVATCNREGSLKAGGTPLSPGDVVTVTWADYGVDALRCRVDAIDLGSLTQGRVTLNLIEDVFDADDAGFDSPDSEADEDDSNPTTVGYGLAYGEAYGGLV